MTGMRYLGVRHEVKTSDQTFTFPAGLKVPTGITFTAGGYLGYDVRLEITLQDGRFVCREVAVRQIDGGPPVTGDSLRDLAIHEMVRAAIRLAVVREEHDEQGLRTFGDLAAQLQAPAGLAKQGATDETLRWVAQAYEVAYALNEPPTKSVQTALGVSRATAGRWVAEARRKGLLTVGAEGSD